MRGRQILAYCSQAWLICTLVYQTRCVSLLYPNLVFHRWRNRFLIQTTTVSCLRLRYLVDSHRLWESRPADLFTSHCLYLFSRQYSAQLFLPQSDLDHLADQYCLDLHELLVFELKSESYDLKCFGKIDQERQTSIIAH